MRSVICWGFRLAGPADAPVLDPTFREVGFLYVNRQPFEQLGDHGGDGGVVLGGETARLALEFKRNGGDVLEVSPGGRSCASEPIFEESRQVACKWNWLGMWGLGRGGVDRIELGAEVVQARPSKAWTGHPRQGAPPTRPNSCLGA